MTKQELIDYCLTYPAAYEDYPFDETTTLIRHSSNKKMFALVDHLNSRLHVTIKCDPIKADFLRGVFESVTPGYHMNKQHWNTVYDGFSDIKPDKADFVHLFVSSQAEFAERYSEASEVVTDNGLLWVSYPKSDRKNKYDINRDSLWGLVIPLGWHPVAQVSLSDEWSAVRLKRNEDGVVYERPGNVKK